MSDHTENIKENFENFELIGAKMDQFLHHKFSPKLFSHLGFLMDQLSFVFCQISVDIDKFNKAKKKNNNKNRKPIFKINLN